MSKSLLILFSFLILLSACNKSSETGITPVKQNPAFRSNAPFSGTMSYQLNTSLDLPCNCGIYAPVGTFSGAGTFSHLGASTSNIKPCAELLIVNGNPVGFYVGMECGSFVAANGDELWCTIPAYNLYFTNTGMASGTIVANFAGGTGRFTNATGSFTGTITNNPVLNTATLTGVTGTINY
jgi:hypothetical protein